MHNVNYYFGDTAISEVWANRFARMALEVATWSKDPSTKVGAVIVSLQHRTIVATGYNGFPRGISDDARLDDRAVKYELIVHAERNALYNALHSHANVDNSIIVVTHPPCVECTKSIIQSGLVGVMYPTPDVSFMQRWSTQHAKATTILLEAGVSYCELPVDSMAHR